LIVINKIKKLYNKSLYPYSIIDKAKGAYSDIVLIKIVDKDKFFECTFYNSNISINLVTNEFNNYLIELLNSKNELL
jgi:hypothetical protein